MYYRKIETNRKAKALHDMNHKAISGARMAEVAKKKRAKRLKG